MDLLLSLGVNSSLVLQLAIFMVAYVVLKYVLFEPYFRAYNERNARTVGQTDLAERLLSETRELETHFATKAQEVNERYKSVYDQSRTQAAREYDRLVTEARQKSKDLVDRTRSSIQAEMTKARGQLKSEVTSVSQLINQKLIGKDLSS